MKLGIIGPRNNSVALRFAFAVLFLMLLGGARNAFAIPCGTIASVTSCAVNVSGGVTFTASNFQFLSSVGLGGLPAYQASDISIDLATGGALDAVFTFSKNASSATPGVSFFANAGQQRSFTFRYDLIIAPSAGTAAFDDLTTTFLAAGAGNGFGSVQTIVSPVSCFVFIGMPSDTCDLSGHGSAITAGSITNLSGNSGNASIGNFTHRYFTSLSGGTSGPGPTPVPEPSSLALCALGLAALTFRRRSRRNRDILHFIK